MKSIYKIVAIGLVLAGSINTAIAGKPGMVRDTLDPLVELMKVQEHYVEIASAPADTTGIGRYASFFYNYYEYINDSVSYFYTNNFTLNTWGNRFAFVMDSITFIQDYQYNITKYSLDSILHVQRPLNFYQAIFQIDLLDTTLQRQVQSVTISDTGIYRYIKFEFKNESPLIKLTVKTDLSGYRLYELEYTMKKDIVPGGTAYQPPSSYHNYTRVHVISGGEAGIIQSVSQFDTSRIIKLENGVLVPTSLYQGFELVNELDK